MKIAPISAVLLSVAVIAGCSTTHDRARNVQSLDSHDGQAIIIYGETERTTTRTPFSTDSSGVIKDQRMAVCEESDGQFACSSMPIIIDGEELSISETESNMPF